VAREARAWHSRALAIPTAEIRNDALSALASKRSHTDGAALFSALPPARNPHLLRLLVAYEIVWDFLDSINEHGASTGQLNGRQLHLALIDALDPDRDIADYYMHHPWREDGSYLDALVGACRNSGKELPSYEQVRAPLAREARRGQVLAINHDLDSERRDADLQSWAREEVPERTEVEWFELTGAASASLTVHALLALAAQAQCSEEELRRTCAAYFPWISTATTMLDSYVDQPEDVVNSDHSYVSHYPTQELAAERIRELIGRCFREARSLHNAELHCMIVACMAAMYLSKDSARSDALRERTDSFVHAGGSLTRLLLPILRLWRVAYAQRSE
jgi:tetraprenyl-beta-curcumene synthase